MYNFWIENNTWLQPTHVQVQRKRNLTRKKQKPAESTQGQQDRWKQQRDSFVIETREGVCVNQRGNNSFVEEYLWEWSFMMHN